MGIQNSCRGSGKLIVCKTMLAQVYIAVSLKGFVPGKLSVEVTMILLGKGKSVPIGHCRHTALQIVGFSSCV